MRRFIPFAETKKPFREGSLALSAQEVCLDPRIALLVCPQGMGKGCEIVDERDSVAVLGQVNGAQIKLTGIASLDAHERRILADKHRQFVLGFFATRRTQDSPELPFLQAERAKQESFSTVALRAQHTNERPRSAKGAQPRRRDQRSARHERGAKLRIGLEERPGKELRERTDLLIVSSRALPIRLEACDPRLRGQQRKLPRRFGERARRVVFNHGKVSTKMRKKHHEVEFCSQLGRKSAVWLHFHGGNLCAEQLLKRRDLFVEGQEFRGCGMA